MKVFLLVITTMLSTSLWSSSLNVCKPYENKSNYIDFYCTEFVNAKQPKIDEFTLENLEIVRGLEGTFPSPADPDVDLNQVRRRLEKIDAQPKAPISDAVLDDALFVLENTKSGKEIKKCMADKFPNRPLRDFITQDVPEELREVIGGQASGFWLPGEQKVVVAGYVSGSALVAVLYHEFLHACDISHDDSYEEKRKLSNKAKQLAKEGKKQEVIELDKEIDLIDSKINQEIFSSEINAYAGTFQILNELATIHPEHVCKSNYKNGFGNKGDVLPIADFYNLYTDLISSGQFITRLSDLYTHLDAEDLFIHDKNGNKVINSKGEVEFTPEFKSTLESKGLLN